MANDKPQHKQEPDMFKRFEKLGTKCVIVFGALLLVLGPLQQNGPASAQTRGFSFNAPKPSAESSARNKPAVDIFDRISALVHSGPDLTRSRIERLLGVANSATKVIEERNYLSGSNEKLLFNIEMNSSWTKANSVYIKVSPKYLKLTPDTVIEKFGQPTPKDPLEGVFNHQPDCQISYQTENYDLSFTSPSNHSPDRAQLIGTINDVSIRWRTAEEWARRLALQKARRDQHASIGKRTAETISWVKALMQLQAVPKSEDLLLIFGKDGEVEGGLWKQRPSPMDNPYIQEPDYSVDFNAHGTADDVSQVVLKPGHYSHRISLREFQEAFGEGTKLDGLLLTPRQTQTVHLSYALPQGSVSVVHQNFHHDDVVDLIKFWWRPNGCSAKIAEDFLNDETLEVVLAKARTEMTRKQFNEAWSTLDLASKRRIASRYKNHHQERYESDMALKSTYLEWFNLQGRKEEVKFIEHVCSLDLFRYLDKLRYHEISMLPTVDEYRKRAWTVTLQNGFCQIRRDETMPVSCFEGLATYERCKKLFGSSAYEKQITDIPADLIDDIYYYRGEWERGPG